MAARSTSGMQQSVRAQRGRRSFALQAKKALRIERNVALRLSPLELQSLLALEHAHAVVLDYEEDPDHSDLGDDEVQFEEMDGDEIDESPAGERDGVAEPTTYLLRPGVFERSDHRGPFLDPGAIYGIAVAPVGQDERVRCHFAIPWWFSRARGTRARSFTHRITVLLQTLARMFSDECEAFLRHPTPTQVALCEWEFFSRGVASIQETMLTRKGLVRRLNDQLGAVDRTDESEIGGLLPHVWLLWSDRDTSSGASAGPWVMPLAAMYERRFQIEAAAELCRAGFAQWTVVDDTIDKGWSPSRHLSRPLCHLDQRERLHVFAHLFRVRAGALLETVLGLERTLP